MKKDSFWVKHLIKLGFLTAIGYWLVESYNDSFIVGVANFYESLVFPPGHELWTRILVAVFLVAISALIKREMMKRLEAERALEANLEKIKQFAFSVAHDLKNPAMGIIGLTNLLKRHCQDKLDKKSSLYFSKITAAAQQISELVDDINTFIRTKEFPLRLENVKLGEICKILQEEYAVPARTRGIRLIFPDTNTELKADRLAILRALRNLIDNSFKYGGTDTKEIIITHEQNDQAHLLAVKDDGQGLNFKDIKNIFQPFKRCTESDIAGSGLGLAIVKEIVEKHGGKVWAETNGGKGATFYMLLAKNQSLAN